MASINMTNTVNSSESEIDESAPIKNELLTTISTISSQSITFGDATEKSRSEVAIQLRNHFPEIENLFAAIVQFDLSKTDAANLLDMYDCIEDVSS